MSGLKRLFPVPVQLCEFYLFIKRGEKTHFIEKILWFHSTGEGGESQEEEFPDSGK
jgi:hypothetical protein